MRNDHVDVETVGLLFRRAVFLRHQENEQDFPNSKDSTS